MLSFFPKDRSKGILVKSVHLFTCSFDHPVEGFMRQIRCQGCSCGQSRNTLFLMDVTVYGGRAPTYLLCLSVTCFQMRGSSVSITRDCLVETPLELCEGNVPTYQGTLLINSIQGANRWATLPHARGKPEVPGLQGGAAPPSCQAPSCEAEGEVAVTQKGGQHLPQGGPWGPAGCYCESW